MESLSHSPTNEVNSDPTASPLSDPSFYIAPLCYEGPMVIQKDSSSMDYNSDMVQINNMNTTEVTLTINNVWGQDDLPEQTRVFIHNNGVNAILDGEDGDGFQCLNTEGSDIDIEGENEFTVECFQESEVDPWLAVIDVVVTDETICGANDATYPCFPDEDPILGSCSWRVVVPCSHNLLCSEQSSSIPTSSSTESPTTLPPTSSSTNGPTTAPTIATTATPTTIPTTTPTATPTATETIEATIDVTASPSISPTAHGTDGDTSDAASREIGPTDCPADILLIHHNGSIAYPDGTVQIISQDTDTVAIRLTQTYTDSSSSVDSVYYQYKHDYFDNICYEEQDFYGEKSMEMTIRCIVNSRAALLELWVADSEVLSEGDSAIIPNCCHPTIPEGTPVTNFVIQINCETSCPKMIK